jgi:hypothetical protein
MRPKHLIASVVERFWNLKMVDLMLTKLGTHGAFAGAAMDRLKMCSDCRVVDMVKKET